MKILSRIPAIFWAIGLCVTVLAVGVCLPTACSKPQALVPVPDPMFTEQASSDSTKELSITGFAEAPAFTEISSGNVNPEIKRFIRAAPPPPVENVGEDEDAPVPAVVTDEDAPLVPVVKTTIEQGVEVIPGDIVTFDASGTVDATLFQWGVEPSKFADGKPTNEVSTDNRMLRLASRTGVYTLTLAIANKTKIVIYRRTVTIGQPAPVPPPMPVTPPSPVPPPTPEPTPPPAPSPAPVAPPKFPDEQLGMSTLAYKAGMAQPDKSRAKALSLSFRQVGGAAAAGGLSSIKDVDAAVVASNRKALVGDGNPDSEQGRAVRAEWLPFFKTLQPRILELSKGKAITPQQYGKMLIEISVGLSEVK